MALRDHFLAINRPEVLGRLGQGVAVFQPLTDEMVERITHALLDKAAFRHGPALEFDRPSIVAHVTEVLADPATRNLGGRQVRNTIRDVLLQAARQLVLDGHADAERIVVRVAPGGAVEIDVDGVAAVREPDRSTNPGRAA